MVRNGARPAHHIAGGALIRPRVPHGRLRGSHGRPPWLRCGTDVAAEDVRHGVGGRAAVVGRPSLLGRSVVGRSVVDRSAVGRSVVGWPSVVWSWAAVAPRPSVALGRRSVVSRLSPGRPRPTRPISRFIFHLTGSLVHPRCDLLGQPSSHGGQPAHPFVAVSLSRTSQRPVPPAAASPLPRRRPAPPAAAASPPSPWCGRSFVGRVVRRRLPSCCMHLFIDHVDRSLPNDGRSSPRFARSGAKLGESPGQVRLISRQTSPNPGQLCPIPAELGPNLAELGPNSANLCPTFDAFGQLCPITVKCQIQIAYGGTVE